MRGSAKNYINYTLNIIMLLSITVSIISSYIIWFVLERGMGSHGATFCRLGGFGSGGNGADPLFGWPRYTWIDIHNWASIILLMIIIIHVITHWRWIVEAIKRTKRNVTTIITKVAEQYLATILLTILFMFECLSGFVLWFILPRGHYDYFLMISGSGRTFWGLQRDIWVDLHAWTAILILSIIIIHLILNWKWIVLVTKNMFNNFKLIKK
jgi:cytochrome b561